MSKTVQMVAVHYANKSGRGKAATFVPYEAAKDWVDARLAVWSKGAKYINLTKTEAEIIRPAASLKPNVKTMNDYVEGKEYAVEIIEAYKFKQAA